MVSYDEIFSCVLKLVCIGISAVFTYLFVPWIKNTLIPWMNERRIYAKVKRFVQAAEKMAASGEINKDIKKSLVKTLLHKSGIIVTDEVDAMIESAVEELDIALKNGVLEVMNAISDGEDNADDKFGFRTTLPESIDDFPDYKEATDEAGDEEEEGA